MLLMEKLIKLVSMMTRYGGPRAELYLKNSADGVLFLSGAEKRASGRKSVSRAGSSLSRSFSPEKNSHLSDLLALLLLSLATVLAAVSMGQHKRRGRRWLLLWARSGARKQEGGLGEWWDWGAARHEPLKLLRVQDPLHLGELPDFLGASHDDRSSLLCSACSCAGLLATARSAVAQASSFFFFQKCPPIFLEMLECIFFFRAHRSRRLGLNGSESTRRLVFGAQRACGSNSESESEEAGK